MKKALKLFGIIAIAAIIGFCLVSCFYDPDNGGGGDNAGGSNAGGGGGNAISDNTITSGAEVVYHPSIKNVSVAKIVTDFDFIYWRVGEEDLYNSVKPLNSFLNVSSSVKVNNSKLTIKLGTPKSDYLSNFFGSDELPAGLTITPNNVKCFGLGSSFYSSDVNYGLECMKDGKNYAMLFYADNAVTIKGTVIDDYNDEEETAIFNVSLKKGWNYVITSYDETTKTVTYTSSTTQPSGYKWTIINFQDYYDYYYDSDY
jgi:hypothetical protein